jgi:hypothetical protein
MLQEIRVHDPDYNATYAEPFKLWLLGTPLIKKKAEHYSPNQMEMIRRLCHADWV